MHVHYKIHGSGKKNLHGDGIAIWYTKERLHPGRVTGSMFSLSHSVLLCNWVVMSQLLPKTPVPVLQ